MARPNLQYLMLQIIENVTCSPFTQQLVSGGLFDLLLLCLDKPEKRGKVFFIVSNIMAGTWEDRQALVDHKIFEIIVQGLSDSDKNCREEASYAVYVFSVYATGRDLERLVELEILNYVQELRSSLQYLKNVLNVLSKLVTSSRSFSQSLKNSGLIEQIDCLQCCLLYTSDAADE